MSKKCEFCLGTGYVKDVQYDTDAHRYYDAGLIECKHPNNYGDNPGTDADD